jgi:hypothetical protein
MAETPREYLARIGRKGGKNRTRNQSPEERTQLARRAAEARWKKNMARIDQAVDEITTGTKALLEKTKAAGARRAKKKKAAAQR